MYVWEISAYTGFHWLATYCIYDQSTHWWIDLDTRRDAVLNYMYFALVIIPVPSATVSKANACRKVCLAAVSDPQLV